SDVCSSDLPITIYGLARSGVSDRPTGGTELSASTVGAATPGYRFDLRALAEVDTPRTAAGRTARTRRGCPARFGPARNGPRHRAAPARSRDRAGAAPSPATRSFRATEPGRDRDPSPRGKIVEPARVRAASCGVLQGVFFRRLSVGSTLTTTDASGRPGNLSQDDVRSSAWSCFTSAEAHREATRWSRARNDAKHDLEARVLECAAGLPGGIENQAHGLSVVAALPALLRREEGGGVQGRTLVVGTHEVLEGLLALLRRQIGDLFLTGEDIITVEVTRVVDLEVVRLLAVDHGNFRDGLVRVGLHLVEAVTDPQRENIGVLGVHRLLFRLGVLVLGGIRLLSRFRLLVLSGLGGRFLRGAVPAQCRREEGQWATRRERQSRTGCQCAQSNTAGQHAARFGQHGNSTGSFTDIPSKTRSVQADAHSPGKVSPVLGPRGQ